MRTMITIIGVLAVATAAGAGVHTTEQNGLTVTITSVPSVSNPGLTVHTVNLSVNNGDVILGWDGTITGNLSQSKPLGFLATIFSDNNAVFSPPYYLDQDSQYLYLTNAMDPVGGALAGASFEDTTQLYAGFALVGGGTSGQAGPAHNLAQVVMPAGQSGWCTGLVLLEAHDLSGYGAILNFSVPEPAGLTISALGALAILRRRRS